MAGNPIETAGTGTEIKITMPTDSANNQLRSSFATYVTKVVDSVEAVDNVVAAVSAAEAEDSVVVADEGDASPYYC